MTQIKPESCIVPNPLAGLMHLATAITTLDSFMDSLRLGGDPHGAYFRRAAHNSTIFLKARDITYARNSLCISHELWQGDLRRRLVRSRQNFYIFSMTGDESLGFGRRVLPAIDFATESLKGLAETWPEFKAQSTVFSILENSTCSLKAYTESNKACLRAALEMIDADSAIEHCLREEAFQVLPLPPLPKDMPRPRHGAA